MIDNETLSDILARILGTSKKWQHEVEHNLLLQETLEELFEDQVFQILLEHSILPKFQDTYVPHFRAIELICALRDLVRQMYETSTEDSKMALELEDLQFEINQEFDTSGKINIDQSLDFALEQARRFSNLYQKDQQFAARIDKFRLLVLPLRASKNGAERYQVLVLKNIRPPRNQWTKK